MYESLYSSKFGRIIAGILARPVFSHISGAFLDTRASRALIKPFINKNNIDLSGVEKTRFDSFNDFFTRKLKDGARLTDLSPDALISPCDGYLSAYEIAPSGRFSVKGTEYTLSELLLDQDLAREFEGGLFLSFRLTPSDYHRYIFIDDGEYATKEKHIKGVYHTVRPTALENVAVYKTNTREYACLDTRSFGKIVQMEVGATLVGRIKNTVTVGAFKRGDEKGMFEFGGSTIIILIGADRARLDAELYEAASNGSECRVRVGMRIGTKLSS